MSVVFDKPTRPTPNSYTTSFLIFVGKNGTLPTKGSQYSAGWDLYSAEDSFIFAKDAKLVDTDINISIPLGWYGRIAPRSGLAVRNKINVGAGIVDADFRGSIKVFLFNHGEADFTIKKGDRIAQLIIERYNDFPFYQVDSLEELGVTDRNQGGFGSTGV